MKNNPHRKAHPQSYMTPRPARTIIGKPDDEEMEKLFVAGIYVTQTLCFLHEMDIKSPVDEAIITAAVGGHHSDWDDEWAQRRATLLYREGRLLHTWLIFRCVMNQAGLDIHIFSMDYTTSKSESGIVQFGKDRGGRPKVVRRDGVTTREFGEPVLEEAPSFKELN